MSWTAGKTWVSGDVFTSADANQYLRDRLAYIYGDSVWTAIPMTSPWVAYGTGWSPAQCRFENDQVLCRGLVRNSSYPSNPSTYTIGTVAAGYRTAKANLFASRAADGTCRLDLTTDGKITMVSLTTPAASTQYVTLDPLRWFIN